MKNIVDIYDNGYFCVTVNGLIVASYNTLGDAWEHIAWMYVVASQDFYVGKKNPVHSKEWLDKMINMGYLDKYAGYKH